MSRDSCILYDIFTFIAVGSEVGEGSRAVIQGPPAVHRSLQWRPQHLADALRPQSQGSHRGPQWASAQYRDKKPTGYEY